MKQRIMEVLLSGDNDLTKDEIQWAIQNIPNETISKSVVYNHDAESVFDACGISDDLAEKLGEEYKTIRENVDGSKKSMLIEAFMNNASPELVKSFIIRALMDYEQQHIQKAIDKLKDMIDKLGK
jgi:hypothetical protein